MATAEEIGRAKETLPRGWGRFGKAIDGIAAELAADEPLLAVVVAIDPALNQNQFTSANPGLLSIANASKRTNIVLGATDRRIVLALTGLMGGPRETGELTYEGLEIAPGDKDTTFSLSLSGVPVSFTGAAKTQLPAFVETVAAHAR
jgi:hypothetical protein